MSNSQPSSIKFWCISAVVLIAAGIALALLWPFAIRFAQSQSHQLLAQAATASGGEAQTDYQLAAWLDPSSQAAYQGLAASQLAAGQASSALSDLTRAGDSSANNTLRVKALIEAQKYHQAQSAASTLIQSAPTNTNLVLAALANCLTGNTAQAMALTPRTSSSEAAQAIQIAASSKLALATQLYATGLLNSSSALLRQLPSSYDRDLLLARINAYRGTSTDISQATSLLLSAVRMSPAATAPRLLLESIYRSQSKDILANQQQALIAKLTTGRP